MKFFIIRHKATGKYMPPKRGTWWEPTVDGSATPRLFARLVDAKNAKRFWENGPLTLVQERPSGPDFTNDGNTYLTRSEHYGLDRKPDDLEILATEMTVFAKPL